MKDMNFLPHWYIDKKVNLCRGKGMAIIILLVLINAGLAYTVIFGSYKIYITDKKKAESESKLVSADIQKDISSIRSMVVFIDDFMGKSDYGNVSIDGFNLSFDIPYNNKNDYYVLVRKIEDSNNYRIISISQTGDIMGASALEVVLEVKL